MVHKPACSWSRFRQGFPVNQCRNGHNEQSAGSLFECWPIICFSTIMAAIVLLDLSVSSFQRCFIFLCWPCISSQSSCQLTLSLSAYLFSLSALSFCHSSLTLVSLYSAFKHSTTSYKRCLFSMQLLLRVLSQRIHWNHRMKPLSLPRGKVKFACFPEFIKPNPITIWTKTGLF